MMDMVLVIAGGAADFHHIPFRGNPLLLLLRDPVSVHHPRAWACSSRPFRTRSSRP
jgi:hypothetical protein